MGEKLKSKTSGEYKENGSILNLGTTQADCYSISQDTFAYPEQCLGKAADKVFMHVILTF